MVTHPSYQIFPHSRCSSPFPHSELFSFSLYPMLLLPLTFLLCNSVTISLVFLSFSLCFSFGYPFHLFVGLSMCLYLSIFLFSPLPKFLSHPRLPISSLSLLLLLGRVLRASLFSLPLPPFSFCLSLSPPTVQSVFCYGRKLFIVNTRDPDSRPWNQLFSQGWIPITGIYTYPFYFFFSRDFNNDFRDDLLGLEAFVRGILIKRFDLCLWLHQNTFCILDKQKSDFFSPIITGLLDLFFFFSTMEKGRSKWILSSCLNACEMCLSNSRFFPTWYNCTFILSQILSLFYQILPFNLSQR